MNEKLLYKYKPLSKKLAIYYYQNMHKGLMTLDDYIQAADIGLFKAILNYNEEYNDFKFINYAKYYIKDEIFKTYRTENSSFSISKRDYENIKNLIIAKKEFIQKYNKDPEIEILSKYLNISEKRIRQLILITNRIGIENINFKDDELNNVEDVNNNIDNIINTKDSQYNIRQELKHLSSIEQKVISLRFGLDDEPKSLRDVSNILNINVKKVKNVEISAIRKMRNPKISKKLWVYIINKRAG